MYSASEITNVCGQLGITHVIWIPDSLTGTWEVQLESDPRWQLIRVCREGEAWAIAAGLQVGGCRPLVVMQMTGFYESADSMRNAVHDLGLPLLAILGGRNMLTDRADSAKTYALPVLDAWQIPYTTVLTAAEKPRLAEQLAAAVRDQQPHFVVIGEEGG